LVNNAGTVALGGILDQDLGDWDRVIETNLNACFLLSKLTAQSMVRQRLGKIINIASEYSLFRLQELRRLTVLRRELGATNQIDGDRARSIQHSGERNRPWMIDTDMVAPVKTMPLYQELLHGHRPAGWVAPRNARELPLFGLPSF